MKPLHHFILAVVTVFILNALVASVSAQTNPTMTEQQRDADREALFSEFSEVKRFPTGQKQRQAYEIAKVYLNRFGSEDRPDTRAVRKFVVEYERFIKEFDLDAAFKAKNYTKTFELGRPFLKAEPENFFVLATLVQAGFENAQTGNTSLNSETVDYARRAIKILDADPTIKPTPFTTAGTAQGFLNFALGWLLKEQSPTEAAAAFVKAIQADSPYKKDPVVYRFLGVAILKGEFTQLSAEYNEKFGNKPSSPEQTAMLQRITHLADRAIDAYARAVVLTTAPEQQEARKKMLAQLTALYKNFHNNSDAGLDELLATVQSKPFPAM